jgi:3-mercaptopyruvate sulfurtransferase SseA
MAGLKPGEIRERPFTTSAGARVIEFDGVDAHFTQQFSRVPRRAMLKSQEEYAQMSRDAQLSRITEVVRYGKRPTVQAPRAGF